MLVDEERGPAPPTYYLEHPGNRKSRSCSDTQAEIQLCET
jgi:hypothetical protein